VCEAYAAHASKYGWSRCGHALEARYNSNQSVYYVKCVGGCSWSVSSGQALQWFST
jgi:hypothetical protein